MDSRSIRVCSPGISMLIPYAQEPEPVLYALKRRYGKTLSLLFILDEMKCARQLSDIRLDLLATTKP